MAPGIGGEPYGRAVGAQDLDVAFGPSATWSKAGWAVQPVDKPTRRSLLVIMTVVKPGRGNSLVRIHHCNNSLSLRAGSPARPGRPLR